MVRSYVTFMDSSVWCARLSVIMSVLWFVSPASAAESCEQAATFKIDPKMQEAIQRILNPKSKEDLELQWQFLRKEDGPRYRRLIPQLLYYSKYGTDPNGKRDVKEGMALHIFVEQLELSRQATVRALIPYIGMQNGDFRNAVLKHLRRFEFREPREHPDFYVYRSMLASKVRRNEELPLYLVKYMYETEPGAALRNVMRAFRLPDLEHKRQIIWAEHEITDVLWKHKHKFLEPDQVEPSAKEELEKLARSEHWWARLYVAEIMRQHRGFRQGELVERLQQDKHPLVRKAIEAFATNAGHE